MASLARWWHSDVKAAFTGFAMIRSERLKIPLRNCHTITYIGKAEQSSVAQW